MFTSNVSLALLRAIAFLAICALPVTGQYGTTYVDVTEDNGNIVAAAVTDTNYYMGGIHTAYATARIVSPNGRTVEVTKFMQNSVTANAIMSIAQEDGAFTAYNWYPQEYCPVGLVYYALALALDNVVIQKWIAIKDTHVSETTIARTNDNVDYTVEVATSTNCAGTAKVIAHLGRIPSTIDAQISKDGDTTGSPQSATSTKSVAGGTNGNFDFDVKTLASNNDPGTLNVSAGFDEIPQGCEWRQLPGGTLVHEIAVP